MTGSGRNRLIETTLLASGIGLAMAGTAHAAVPTITSQPGEQVLQLGQRGGFLVQATGATAYQ